MFLVGIVEFIQVFIRFNTRCNSRLWSTCRNGCLRSLLSKLPKVMTSCNLIIQNWFSLFLPIFIINPFRFPFIWTLLTFVSFLLVTLSCLLAYLCTRCYHSYTTEVWDIFNWLLIDWCKSWLTNWSSFLCDPTNLVFLQSYWTHINTFYTSTFDIPFGTLSWGRPIKILHRDFWIMSKIEFSRRFCLIWWLLESCFHWALLLLFLIVNLFLVWISFTRVFSF